MRNRVWELDALRGIFIFGMIIIHFVYDMVELYGILSWDYPIWYRWMASSSGVLFLLLSGLCATLGRRSVRRGLTVFGCGMLVSLVTVGMYLLNITDKSIIIYFGVLHCLGVCMMLWWLFKRFPTWLLAVLGLVIIGLGLYLENRILVDHLWLMPLGFTADGFITSDYYPLLPSFGYFLLGAVIGRTVYRKKVTRFPRVNTRNPLIRALCFCGRHSLEIYLLHQPILAGICMLLI